MRRDIPALVLVLLASVLCANAQAPQAENAGQANAPKPAGPATVEPLDLPAVAGSNGAKMSLRDCLSQTHACSIQAPALHAQAEAQVWGSGNVLETTSEHIKGPKSTDPVGCVMDSRWGPPQVICNQGLPNGTSGRFNGSSPIFSQNITQSGTGMFAHYPKALSLQDTVFTGTHDLGGTCAGGLCGDEQNATVLFSTISTHAPVEPANWESYMYAWSPDDTIPMEINARTVGQKLSQHEGMEIRIGMSESGDIYQATLNNFSCGVTCTLTLAQTAGAAGGYGAGLPLIDLTQGYNVGYVSAIRQINGTPPGVQINGSSTNWDATYGTSTYTTTTANVDNSTCPRCNGSTNTFPQSNVTIAVESTEGFSAGQVACEFDTVDPSWECNHITAVGSGTLTIDQMNFPLRSKSTIATGGLTGYGFGMDADWVVGTSMNGIANFGDSPVNGTIRVIYPIVYSTGGNVARIFNFTNARDGYINTRAYTSMSGSGGSCSAKVSGGRVSAATATGGSGYIDTNRPPQLVLSGITSTTAPVIYVSGISGGSLTGASIANAGAGISGTPTCTVVTSNPYHIYPQALVLDAYNHATGALDGSAVVSAPITGKFANTDKIEQEHYPVMLRNGIRTNYATYQPGGRNHGFSQGTSGLFEDGDYEASFLNGTSPTVYAGFPGGATPYIQGQGQIHTPNGLVLRGPHRNGIEMSLPPYGASEGTQMGALVVGCGTPAQCALWNSTYPVLNAEGWNSSQTRRTEDIFGYNPATQTWTLTAGAKGSAGSGSSCALSFGPSGLSLAGPNCASHITMRNSAELRTDRPARLLPAVVESRTGSALAENESAVADPAAEGDSITINGVTCAAGSPCTVLPGSNVPAWLQYLGTGADGANTNASGALSGEKFYTDFTVPSGMTVTVDASKGGLVVHATGACTIAGSIVAQSQASSSGVTGGSGGGGGGGAAAGAQGKSSYPTIAASGFGAEDGGVPGAANGRAAGNGASMPGSLIRAFSNSGGGADGLYLLGAGGGQGANSGGAGGAGGGGVVLICASISGNDGAYNGVIDASGGYGLPGAADGTGAGGGGGGGAVILSSQAKVESWPAVHSAGGPGALASVPQALATGGSCTARPKIVLGVASGTLSSCTVAQPGAGCGAGTGVVWNIVGGGGTGGTITATWSGGALQSCQAQGGAGYTAATYATAGAGGDGGNGWNAKFQGW